MQTCVALTALLRACAGWGLDNRALPDSGYHVQPSDLDIPPTSPSMVAWPEHLDGRPDYSQMAPFPSAKGLAIRNTKGTQYGQYTFLKCTARLLNKEIKRGA